MAGASGKKRADRSGSPSGRLSTEGVSSPTDSQADVGALDTRVDEHAGAAVSAPAGAARQKQQSNDDAPAANQLYDSPLKRVRRAVIRGANKRVIESVDELKAFIFAEDSAGRGVPANVASSIVIRMRVAFITFDNCSTGAVTRIHLVDKCVEDDVDEMHKVFRDNYGENKAIVDSELATVSLYGVDDTSVGLPLDGDTIVVTRMWSLKLFSKQSCQLTTSLDALKIEA